MARFFRAFVYTMLFAAVTAAVLVLWLSPDPVYTVKEWVGQSDYWRYDDMIRISADKHGLDPLLLKAQIWRESAFNRSKVGNSGERGLMQVGEAAARDWSTAVKNETFVPSDLFDPKTNLDAGGWYFHRALERWKDRDKPVVFALAEYNAGKSRVDRWIGQTGLGEKANADDLLGAMDIRTTRDYIEEILRRRQFYEDRGRM